VVLNAIENSSIFREESTTDQGDYLGLKRKIAFIAKRQALSKLLSRAIMLIRGVRALREWVDRVRFLMIEALRRAWRRYSAKISRFSAQDMLGKVSHNFYIYNLKKTYVQRWLRRAKRTAKLKAESRIGEKYYYFNKCSVLFITWYSSTKNTGRIEGN
jgi:hypothetical protein